MVEVFHGTQDAKRLNSKTYLRFQNVWSSLSEGFKVRLDALSQSLVENIDLFLQQSHARWVSLHDQCHEDALNKSSLNPSKINHIPTALVISGVNTPDHQALYEHICRSVLRNHEGHVAVIAPGSNTTSSRALIAAVVQKLVNNGPGSHLVSNTDTTTHACTYKSTENGNLNNLAPIVRSSYLALTEWYYKRFPLAAQTLNQDDSDEHVSPPKQSKSPVTNAKPRGRSSKRGNSQLSSVGITRSTRSSLFSRPTEPVRPPAPRRFTMRSGSGRQQCEKRSFSESKLTIPITNPSENESQLPKGSSCAKKTPFPLVIVIPQVESLPSSVLQEFIELTAIYRSGSTQGQSRALPLYLVLGLSTTPEAGFETRLTAPTLGKLSIQRFTAPPPAAFLDAVLTELIDFPGFHLNSSSLTYLVDSLFLCLDYSIQNFIRRVKFCVLDHYLRCPHTDLLSLPDEAQQYLESLSSVELAQMVSVTYPSLVNLAVDKTSANTENDSSPVSNFSKLSLTGSERTCNDGKQLISLLTQSLKSQWCLQYRCSGVLRWLLALFTPITSRPIGKSLSELYRAWLKSDFFQSESFLTTMNLFSGLSREAIVQCLRDARAALQLFISSNTTKRWAMCVQSDGLSKLSSLVVTTDEWCKQLELLKEDAPVEPSVTQLHTPISPALNALKSPAFESKRKLNMRDLRQHLQEIAAYSPVRCASPGTQLKSEWERQRTELISWIRTELVSLLPPPSTLPLHEIFYGPFYSRISSLSARLSIRRHLNPPLRKCIHVALTDPGTYLNVSEFGIPSPESISGTLPDMCIIYKLHLESIKMINLYDWLMAFATVLGEQVDKETPPNQQTQARFLHGLSQLHYLGYIRSTRRKADHVMRITSDCL